MFKKTIKLALIGLATTCALGIYNTYAMDEDSNAPASQHRRPQWEPNMTAISSFLPNNTCIKIFGNGPKAICDFILPEWNRIENIILTKDDTFFIHESYDRSVLEVKDGKTLERHKYGMMDVEEIKALRDGTIVIRGRDQLFRDCIITLKDGKISNHTDKLPQIGRLYDMVITSDNTVFFNMNFEYIIEFKDGEFSEPQNYGLSRIGKFTVGPDGDFCLQGDVEGTHSIVMVKEGKASQPQNYGLNQIHRSIIGADGTLYVVGKVENKNALSIIMVKDGDALEVQNDYGLNDIVPLKAASDETAYFKGRKGYGHLHYYFIKDGKIAPLNHDLELVDGMYPSKDDTLFLVGTDQGQENQRAIMVKNGESAEIGEGRYMDIHPIIYASPFDAIFKKEMGKIFSDINIGIFKALCEEIQAYPGETSHEDGMLFYNFFARNILDFQTEEYAEYVEAMDHLLSALTNRKNSSLYGYACTLSFERQCLEAEIFLHDGNMSVDSLLAKQQNPDFEEQLKRTQEAQEILKAIVDHTSPNFAQRENYKRLGEMVKNALEVFPYHTPLPSQEQVTPWLCTLI